MLQLETQSNFQGFGNGQLPGELHYSSNMAVTPFGFAPFLKNTTEQNSNALASLTLIRWFIEESGISWAIGGDGKVFSRASGNWALEKSFSISSEGNGLILDQTGRMLAMHERYLSKKDAAGSVSWTESWKDMGTSVIGDKGMDTYQDWVVIPHGNKVGLLNVTDDSFNNAGLTFPTGCTCIVAKTNRTGVLLGVNMASRSFIALWDAQSNRAIADWIWFDHPLKSICRAGNSGWIVTTSREIVQTDGYTTKTLPLPPDQLIGEIGFDPIVGATRMIGNKLYIASRINGTNYGRRQAGLFILDLAESLSSYTPASGLWTFVPASDYCTQNVRMGAVYEDSSARIWLAHTNDTSNVSYVSTLNNAVPTTANFITAPFGQTNTRKVAEGAKVEIAANHQYQGYLPMTFTVSVKVYDFTRPLWTYGVTSTCTVVGQLVVNGSSGTYNNAKVGDEVTVLTGLNAGSVRHITVITNQGASNETWTLDSNLANVSETGAWLQVQPFKLAQKFTLSNIDSIPIDGLYFDIRNRVKGKKFLLKVLFENLSNVTALVVPSVSLIYDDLGII